MTQTIRVEEAALARNDLAAQENRRLFDSLGLIAVNMISAPGSGKTSILEFLGQRLGKQLAVVTGDIQTTFDADRINKSGAECVQVETGGGCHLTAEMVAAALKKLDLSQARLLVIENVGNLVCPAIFELGEHGKIAVLSVAEGHEKPAKYPSLFVRAQAVAINKIDLLPYVDFNLEQAESDCRKLNPEARIFRTSCRTKEGMEELSRYLTTASAWTAHRQ